VCEMVVGSLITRRMTDYEKELTVHDWIIKRAQYDPGVLSNAPDAKPDPDNDNPYGLLINRNAICMGYTMTFKLFMDLLDIECIVVEGFAHGGENEHAWNMVRLDGEWYKVDVTWNDPVSTNNTNTYLNHKYFNVTSQFMRESDHQWDEGATPEATATKYAWRPAG